MCVDCIEWDAGIDQILTWRGPPPDVNPVREHKRDYLVKFKERSHMRNKWVPDYWLEALSEENMKFKAFMKKVEMDQFESRRVVWPKAEDDVVMDEWLNVERIVNVEVNDEGELEWVLIKWCRLPYEDVTWEKYSHENESWDEELQEVNEELREQIDAAYAWYEEGVAIAERSPSKTTPKFVEKKLQPKSLSMPNGFKMKGYQLDGLNWMLFNWHRHVPCVLADDMGLGKTVQISECQVFLCPSFAHLNDCQ
jgi:SNF2 family DNA or RNA helicase